MSKLKATVVSVHASDGEGLSKDQQQSIIVELDGVVGDRHRSFSREAWAGDKQPKGTERRNERQWSAVSVQELADISAALALDEPLTAGTLGANICLDGVEDFSQLPKGTTLRFPSGAELIIEEYNPPCLDMGTKIANTLATKSGEPLENTDFSKAAKLTRGVVGTVEVAGIINPGDPIEITPYEQPQWLNQS